MTPESPRERLVVPGRLAVAMLLGAAACLAGCQTREEPSSRASSPSIVLVTIDTLRADHLGCYGYFRDTSPHIDRLAAESVFFEQAYSPMATTLPSHTSILTGLSPLEHGILANQEHGGGVFVSRPGAASLAEFLRDEGYATAAFVSATPVKRSSGISAGFDVFHEPKAAQCSAEATTEPALRWIKANAGKKVFVWVHYYDPHWPREPPEPYISRYRDEPALEEFLAARRIPDAVAEAPCKLATVTRAAINAYDGAIRYVDHEIGRLLDTLRETGLLERSVVVVTSDHGEGLNQHDWPAHGRNYDEQLRVPLILRFPGPRPDLPKRFRPIVSLVDVMPTVLGRIGPPVARSFLAQASGRDVLSDDFEERPILSRRTARDCGDGAGTMFALTARSWKYFFEPETGDRLYDRLADPYELRDVLADRPAVGEDLRRQVLSRIEKESLKGKSLAIGQGNSPPVLDPQVLKELESLGYTGGDPSAGGSNDVSSGARGGHRAPDGPP